MPWLPDKGSWIIVVVVKVGADGRDQFLDIAVHHVEPRTTCRRETYVEAWMAGQRGGSSSIPGSQEFSSSSCKLRIRQASSVALTDYGI